MRLLCLTLLFTLWASTVEAAPLDTHQSKFGFSLTTPDSTWRILDEEQVKEIQPLAVAGLVNSDGIYNVVVIESLPSQSLKDLAHHWADNSGLQNAELNLFEEQRFGGEPAIRWMVSGKSSEKDWTQHFVIFVREKSLYRLVSWAPTEKLNLDGSSFQPFLDAFELSAIDHESAAATAPAPEANNVGWLITKGAWKSAAYGIEIQPTDDWRLVYGAELREWNSLAAIGMIDADSSSRLTLQFERIDKKHRGIWNKLTFERFASELAERREAILANFAGHEIELRVYDPAPGGDGSAPGMRTLIGCETRTDLCVQFRIDYPIARESVALENLSQAFASMRLMEHEETRSIDARVKSAFSEPNQVGDGYSLRSGVYRDFRLGLAWKRPTTEWEIETGQAAIERLPDAVLAFHNPYWSLRGAVVPTPKQSVQSEGWHRQVLGQTFASMRTEITESGHSVQLGDLTGRCSGVLPTLESSPIEYRVLTATNDSWAFKILLWGPPSSFKLAQDEVAALLKSFTISASPNSAVVTSTGAMYDDRLGFQLLSPGDDWDLNHEGEERFWPAGALAEWSRGEEDCFGVIAISGLSEGEDPTFLASLVRSALPDSYADWLRAAPDVREVYFCGQASREISWDRVGRKVSFWTIAREETLYLVYATDDLGELDSERACDLFALIP
jgi:hypothetical protein